MSHDYHEVLLIIMMITWCQASHDHYEVLSSKHMVAMHLLDWAHEHKGRPNSKSRLRLLKGQQHTQKATCVLVRMSVLPMVLVREAFAATEHSAHPHAGLRRAQDNVCATRLGCREALTCAGMVHANDTVTVEVDWCVTCTACS